MGRENLQKQVREYALPVQTVIHINQTLEEALKSLREKHISDKIVYIYVVDDENHLKGVVPTRALLLSDPKTPINEIMQKGVICLKGTQTLQQALEFLESHHLLALPVVDEENKLLGIVDVQIYFDEQIDVMYAKRRSDIFQMLGFYLEEEKKTSPLRSYRNRMPWIFCNMFGGVACAIISNFFDVVLAKVLILAMFIPLVLSLSESISMQSMTQSLQLIRRGRMSWKYIVNRVIRESKLLLMLAATCGVIVGFTSLLWGEGPEPGLAIATGIFLSIVITGCIGVFLPLFLHKKHWEPQVAAGPIVLTCADVITTALYLGLATLFLL
jgi:magnesium transporter